MTVNDFPLLAGIQSPPDLRTLAEAELAPLCQELRQFLIQALNQTGGHFGASLGVVELTVALHYLLNTPEDRLIWDVGHQAYIHKLLTGRATYFNKLRQTGGISGFPSRFESHYDHFGVGHSSTSISAALGMAIANQRLGAARQVVAIIGDGALTAGMAFEALNHTGETQSDLLIILNDNGMSISPNVGALGKHMQDYSRPQLYETMRTNGKKLLHLVPSPLRELAKRTEQQVHDFLLPGSFFTELGIDYLGPTDGHNLSTLLPQLRQAINKKGPRVLHIFTQKGKGYAPAEADPVKYHAVSANFLDPQTKVSGPTKLSYSDIFGQWICDMAQCDSRLVAITPATREGSGLVRFSQQFPTRYFDVGIAEQHAVTFAAGLACEGLKPIVAIYSTFLQRAYDQLIHDVALQQLPVLFAVDRAGLVGADGPTHAGSFDLSYLRCIPNLIIMVPADENDCRQMLYTGFSHQGPAIVRFPRGVGSGITVASQMHAYPLGKAILARPGKRIALLAFGPCLHIALSLAEKLDASVLNMRFAKPLDTEWIEQLAANHDLLITLEENAIKGGAGSGVNEYLAEIAHPIRILNLGLPDVFLPQGDLSDQLRWAQLSESSILHRIHLLYPELIPAALARALKQNTQVTAFPLQYNKSPHRLNSMINTLQGVTR